MAEDPRAFSRALWRRLVQLLGTLVIFAVFYFGAVGRIDAWRGWVWIGASFVLTAINGVIVLRVNPEIVAARSRRGPATRGFDKVVMTIWTVGYLATPLVAGLQDRLGSGLLAGGWTVAGLALLAIGMAPISWSMAVNRHLETTVRIQEDRGHRVVDSGPYRWVRHPMYVGVLVQTIATPATLGSTWALVPTLGILVALVTRTALEDRTLRAELPGYAEYANRTRWRLLPGIW
jgi:protein-S-isoprenylcysteine O-methyltransferase Ste14